MVPSALYTRLEATAREFIASTEQVYDLSKHPRRVDEGRIHAIRSPDFRQGFGHRYMCKDLPFHEMGTDEFIDYMTNMNPWLDSWLYDIEKIWIDESKHAVIMYVNYHMVAKGGMNSVEHDIVWTMTMNEAGDKVVHAIEYLDLAAIQEIGRLIGELKAKAAT